MSIIVHNMEDSLEMTSLEGLDDDVFKYLIFKIFGLIRMSANAHESYKVATISYP